MEQPLSRTTIAALATAAAPAGVAIVRISGPRARAALADLFRPSRRHPTDHPREMIVGDILSHDTQTSIDQALAVYMPGPHSFTGEDVVEFQLHGSPLLVQQVLRSLYAFGIQPAQPGEFTKRAFLNGKLDLIQAEAIADLIDAQSENALKIAREQLRGRFSSALHEIGEPLRNVLAEVEAHIDFPEEDIHPESLTQLSLTISLARDTLLNLVESYGFGQIVKEGFRVLLCGQPNVGKSSLLNLLLNRKRAIVSPTPGTTRDIIEEQALFSGFRFIFCDSAGLRSTEDSVEKMGIELAQDRIEWADLVLFVVDAQSVDDSWKETVASIQPRAKKIWLVINKVDLNPGAIGQIVCESTVCHRNLYLSAQTKAGFIELVEMLVEEVRGSTLDSTAMSTIITNERQRNHLREAHAFLQRSLEAITAKMPLELISADLRSALNSLDEIIGRTYTEDILGRVFHRFCIGK